MDPMTAIAAAQLAIGVGTSITGAGADRASGRRKMGYIGEQRAMLQGAGQQVTELAGMKTELSQDIYGTQDLWWLICLVNRIYNPINNPELGEVYKIIKPDLVSTLLNSIKNQL